VYVQMDHGYHSMHDSKVVHVCMYECMYTCAYEQELERQVGVSVADINARYQRDAEKRAVAAKKADR
jgi:hypothetical protein